MFRISIAGLTVEIDNKYGYVRALAKDYITEAAPDFAVSCTSAEIELEANGIYSPEYSESIVIYRKIAEALPRYGAVVFHGAVLASDLRAYAFTARSGVGKTTHINNWLKAFGKEYHVLNGDKPIIRKMNGRFYACGTPWQGKENLGVNEMKPLEVLAFLGRGEKNEARKIDSSVALMPFMSQIYIPNSEREAELALALAGEILGGASLFSLRVNMDEESAWVARRAFEGN